jgi:hypothetical protein
MTRGRRENTCSLHKEREENQRKTALILYKERLEERTTRGRQQDINGDRKKDNARRRQGLKREKEKPEKDKMYIEERRRNYNPRKTAKILKREKEKITKERQQSYGREMKKNNQRKII